MSLSPPRRALRPAADGHAGIGTAHGSRRRRRGTDLERAILENAWAELVEHGYAGLTMEGVAARAGTSRSVLARRWESRASLAIAAILRQMARHPLDVADRGDLRSELLDYLDRASERSVVVAVVHSLLSSGGFRDASCSPQDLHRALADGEQNVLAAILERAVRRGEIDPRRLVPAVATLPSDLFRHHALMTLSAPPPQLRETWVDAIFMPLLRAA
jgi:AcrR family transcriptional regulator